MRDGLLERLQSRVAADDAGSLDKRKRRHAAYPADDGEVLGPFDADAPVVAVVTTYDVAEEEDEQYCDGCHAPVSDPAACKACKKKLCYACAKTTAEEYEEASPWYCPECNH